MMDGESFTAKRRIVSLHPTRQNPRRPSNTNNFVSHPDRFQGPRCSSKASPAPTPRGGRAIIVGASEQAIGVAKGGGNSKRHALSINCGTMDHSDARQRRRMRGRAQMSALDGRWLLKKCSCQTEERWVPSRFVSYAEDPSQRAPPRSVRFWSSNPRWHSRPFRNRTFIIAASQAPTCRTG
jgi:hypothetical protein